MSNAGNESGASAEVYTLREKVRELEAEVREACALVPRWRDAKTDPPELGVSVIGWGDEIIDVVWLSHRDDWHTPDGQLPVTHWQPLPEPPESTP